MNYSRVARMKLEKEMRHEKRRYSFRKVSTIGLASAVLGTVAFLTPVASADEVVPSSPALEAVATAPVTDDVENPTAANDAATVEQATPEVAKADQELDAASVAEVPADNTVASEETAQSQETVDESKAVTQLTDGGKNVADKNQLEESQLSDAQKEAINQLSMSDVTSGKPVYAENNNSAKATASQFKVHDTQLDQELVKNNAAYSTELKVSKTLMVI